jgi:hypothetical protein
MQLLKTMEQDEEYQETENKIKVMQAFVEGKSIVCSPQNNGLALPSRWRPFKPSGEPEWNWTDYDYRVDPQNRESFTEESIKVMQEFLQGKRLLFRSRDSECKAWKVYRSEKEPEWNWKEFEYKAIEDPMVLYVPDLSAYMNTHACTAFYDSSTVALEIRQRGLSLDGVRVRKFVEDTEGEETYIQVKA